MFRLLVTLAILSLSITPSSAAGGKAYWDYWTNAAGPSKWADHWPVCNGSQQSPIDIDTNNVMYDSNIGNITFKNYNTLPSGVNMIVKNNGHSLTVEYVGYQAGNVPTIMNGGLPGTFKLIGFHFHWGSINARGAEHHIDQSSHAAELHLVHTNTKYSNLNDNFGNKDGLAVLGVFIKQGQKNNVFDKFLDLTKYNVTYPDQTAQGIAFAPSELLPATTTFYRYNGSLTTPNCQEVVTWTVFNNDIEISADQLNEFRKLKYVDTMNVTKQLVDTHRPTQQLKGRKVYSNFMKEKPTSKSTTLQPSNLASLVCITVVYIFFQLLKA